MAKVPKVKNGPVLKIINLALPLIHQTAIFWPC